MTEADCYELAKNMRQIDRIECWAVAGCDLDVSNYNLWKRSTWAYSAFYKGKLGLCWGRFPGTVLVNECIVWMLATPVIEDPRFGLRVARETRGWVDRLIEGVDRIHNCVWEENELTIRWLKWAGFTFDGSIETHRGLDFLRFERKGN